MITTPYFERKRVFNKIKEKTKAIFFEKPYAMNTEDYHYLSENFEDYQITVGYMRRLMGNVKNIKSIIDENVFGELKNIDIQFGDIHYKFDSFRSDINQAGGGILVEAGSHWVDTVLYTTSALDIKNFYSKKKIS